MRRAFGTLSAACLAVLAAAQPLAAQEGAAAADPKAAEPPKPPVEVSADVFRVRSGDGQNELRLAAAAHFDARGYLGDSVAPNSFDIRRARIDVQAKLHGFMDMRIQAALEDSPYIRNAWLDLRRSEALHLRVGQMKVPFSTEWLTLDNQVNFVERASSRPVYPFFDRGLMVWGDLAKGRLTYGVGAFTGVGVDLDATKGDIDDHKDVVGRLFVQPFAGSEGNPLRGLYLAGGATYGRASVPTTRFELGGLTAANYESRVWRWRTEQTLGTNGRAKDALVGEIDSRTRWGLEAHYVNGPFLASFEYAVARYDDIAVFHDYCVGSNRQLHQPVLTRNGDIELVSGWMSLFLTGEQKKVDFHGWRQPDAKDPWAGGKQGHGAWEILLRFSRTATDSTLFDSVRVTGFGASDLASGGSPAVGEGGTVAAAVLQGAPKLYEATVGVNWTTNRNLRTQLNVTWLWAPDFEDGRFGIVSGAGSDLWDATEKNRQVERELSVCLRLIFRL